jgi:protein O-GlcNAc transferase
MGLFSRWLRRQTQDSPLDKGLQLLAQGRDIEAREILEWWIPNAPAEKVPPALAGLARAYLGLNLDDLAADAVRHGLALDDNRSELHLCDGLCKARAGDVVAAECALRRSLELDPGNGDTALALYPLLCSSGRAAEALDLEERRPAQATADPRFLFARANIYAELSRLDEARTCLLQLLQRSPEHPEALMNLGVIESRRQDDDRAVALFQEAMSLKPGDAETALNLAISLRRLGRTAEAIDLLEALDADDAKAHRIFSLLADLHAESGELDKAKLCHAKAATLDVQDPVHHYRLGTILLETGHFSDATDALAKSLAVRETHEAHRAMGLALLRCFRPYEAVAHLELAQGMQPDDGETNILLTSARANLNRSAAEQLADCHRVVSEHPDQAFAHSNLLFHLSYDENTTPQAYLEEALKFGQKFRGSGALRSIRTQHISSNSRSGPLRVGFVSADLHSHPVGYFFDALVSEIDTSAFKLFGFPNSPKSDALTRKIQSRFTEWELIRFLDDQKAADLIRSREIDILFDLSGHTGMNRLTMFTHRPAPIQATWLGYWASTGLSEMDYLVADPLSVPPEHQEHFCERVIRMPVTRLCYGSSLPQHPAPADAPCLEMGYVTFGCFQSLHKISDLVVHAWRRIMETAPACRLRIRCVQFTEREVLLAARERLVDLGLPIERVELLPPLARNVYLQAYSEVDVALDTFPYPGGTTTTEALWMGVPTITMDGTSMLARQGLALMSAAGMSEWVSRSVDEYVDKAVQICTNPAHILSMRKQVRSQVQASPLFDTRRFARDFEDLLAQMAAGQPPAAA